MRRTIRLCLAMAVGCAGLVAVPGTASAAPTEAVLGAPCTAEDLGRRVPVVETAVVDPTITHFQAYYVTSGATGSQQVALTYIQAVTVTVIKTKEISAGFNIDALIKLNASGKISFQTQTATATTNQSVSTLTWNFNQPGYYGVYQGVRKVTGQLSTLNCNQVTKPDGSVGTEWIKRPGGTYTTFGFNEQGVIRCEDVVPPTSIMRKAQLQLGCDLSAAARAKAQSGAKTAAAKAPAGKPVAVPSIAEVAGVTRPAELAATRPQAAPTGGPSTLAALTCSPWYYLDTASPNTSLVVRNSDSGTPVETYSVSSGTPWQWSLCTGAPDAEGYPQTMIKNRASGKCWQVMAVDNLYDDGNTLEQRSCAEVPSQQFRIFRDVPGSNKIGIQSMLTDHMVTPSGFGNGNNVIFTGGGRPDGMGTFNLVLA